MQHALRTDLTGAFYFFTFYNLGLNVAHQRMTNDVTTGGVGGWRLSLCQVGGVGAEGEELANLHNYRNRPNDFGIPGIPRRSGCLLIGTRGVRMMTMVTMIMMVRAVLYRNGGAESGTPYSLLPTPYSLLPTYW